MCVSAPHIAAACSSFYTSNTRLTISWPATRGASSYDLQAYNYDTRELIYSVTVYTRNFTKIQLTKVESNSLYVFYVTGSGNRNQVGNNVSCIGVTGRSLYVCSVREIAESMYEIFFCLVRTFVYTARDCNLIDSTISKS